MKAKKRQVTFAQAIANMPSYQRIPAQPPTPTTDTPDTPANHYRDALWGQYDKRDGPIDFDSDERRRTTMHRVVTVVKALEHAALLIVLVLLLYTVWEKDPKTIATKVESSTLPKGVGFVPDFPYNHPVEFLGDGNFTIQYVKAHKSENPWDYLMPRDGGWVTINDPAKYNMAGGYRHADGSEAFMVAAYHSLHCIRGLQTAIVDLQAGKKIEEDHVNHCVDYVRQSILCSADTTLERVMVTPDGVRVHMVNGIGNLHVCRNIDEITDWVNLNGDKSAINRVNQHWAGRDRMPKEG